MLILVCSRLIGNSVGRGTGAQLVLHSREFNVSLAETCVVLNSPSFLLDFWNAFITQQIRVLCRF